MTPRACGLCASLAARRAAPARELGLGSRPSFLLPQPQGVAQHPRWTWTLVYASNAWRSGSYCMFTEHLLTQVPPHTDVLPGSLLAGTRSQKQKPCLVPNALLFRETSRPTESCSWTPPTSTPLTVLQPRPCFRLLAELTRHRLPVPDSAQCGLVE